MVRLILELEGHDVVEAHHGAAALQRLGEGPVELVITDVMMPVMDGTELINRIRANPSQTELPVIVISASPHNVDRANHVMHKPFAPAALRRIVADLLGANAAT